MVLRLPGTRCRANGCNRQTGLRWQQYAFWCEDHGPGDDNPPAA